MSGNHSQAENVTSGERVEQPIADIKTYDVPVPTKGLNIRQEHPLFSTRLVVEQGIDNPVVVVGLPRSGSSFLAHVLSQIEDLFVFDDFYLYREVKALKVDGALTNEQVKKLVFFLGWVLRARVMWPSVASPKYTLDDIDKMCIAVEQALVGKEVYWHELMEEWLTRLARFHDCQRWGYKAPQDFMHLAMIKSLYPKAKIIFLMRDPRKVMASMKFVRLDDGNPKQYHPVAYALYWKMAAKAMLAAREDYGGDVHEVYFEKLRDQPEEQAARIAEFLDMKYSGELGDYHANTSFEGKRPRDITPTEKWICQRVAGELMEAVGYEKGDARFRIVDLPDLLWISIRFSVYQGFRAIFKKSRRQSIVAYVKTALGIKSKKGSNA